METTTTPEPSAEVRQDRGSPPDSRRYLDGNWMKGMQKGEVPTPVIKTAAQIVMEDKK